MIPTKDPNVITIQDILNATKRLTGRQVRNFLRASGYKAPDTGLEGMNPKKKYEFPKNDPHFQKVLTSLLDYDANPLRPSTTKAVKYRGPKS